MLDSDKEGVQAWLQGPGRQESAGGVCFRALAHKLQKLS